LRCRNNSDKVANMDKRKERWVTVAEGARDIGRPVVTVRWWCSHRKVRAYKSGSAWRVLVSSLRLWNGLRP
jgi:hypothetical protein